MVVAETKTLIKHVDRMAVLECAWEHGVRKCTVEKVNGMYSNMYYR